MRSIALAFAGGIGSGKTTLSTELAGRLDWPRVGFGDYVRSVAAQRGIASTRDRLQSLGVALIEDQGWDNFCHSVLRQSVWQPGFPIVIDGVRHVEAAMTLRILVAPSVFLLVFVKADPVLRAGRLAERKAVYDLGLLAAEAHSTEEQLAVELPSLANLTVDGSQPSHRAVAAIIEWLRRQ